METANLELCKTLWELSGWAGTERYFQEGGTVWHNLEDDVSVENSKFVCFAYDLGFLLRKLPACGIVNEDGNSYHCWANYNTEDDTTISTRGGNAENSLCKLAIELFRQGILKK